MNRRKPYLSSNGIIDRIEQLKNVIDSRYDLLKQELHEKHLANRESVHEIRNTLQNLVDRMTEVEKEVAVISGSSKIPGELFRMKEDLKVFMDKMNEQMDDIDSKNHKNDLRWAKGLGWVSCLGFLSAVIIALAKWVWNLYWTKH